MSSYNSHVHDVDHTAFNLNLRIPGRERTHIPDGNALWIVPPVHTSPEVSHVALGHSGAGRVFAGEAAPQPEGDQQRPQPLLPGSHQRCSPSCDDQHCLQMSPGRPHLPSWRSTAIVGSRVFVLDPAPGSLLSTSCGSLELFHPCGPQVPFRNVCVITALSHQVVVE